MGWRSIAFGILMLANMQAWAWPSPIDYKYQKIDPVLYQKYDEARSLLDKYAGESEFLDLGSSRLQYVLKKDVRFAPAYMQLGRLLIMNDDSDDGFRAAEPAVKKALEIEPDYADALVLLGYVYTHLGKHQQAMDAFKKAETIGTQNPWLYVNLADEYLQTERGEDALHALDIINQRGTDNIKARRAISEMYITYYMGKKDLKSVDVWYRKEIEASPGDAWAHGNYAGMLVWHAGNFVEAEKQAREALALMDYGRARFTLAAALFARWADTPVDNRSQRLFDEAVSNYPDVEDMANEFSGSETTRRLADELRKAIPKKKPDVI